MTLVYRSDATDSDRQFWLAALVFLYPLAVPVFWYRVIWKGMSISNATRGA